MKIESLGHASLMVYGADATLLFDPLLYGVHQEGLYDVYPQRELDLAQLPSFDAVVISHAHRDHFDPDSVALLPRDTPMIVANDPLLVGSLEGLGFENILVAQNFVPLEVGALTLVPTPSSPGAQEHGFVIAEQGTTAWNLIDTFPSSEVIARVCQAFDGIDILIAPWQPLQDTTFSCGTPVHFPYAMYARMLANIQQISPRYLVPGACGFRAVGPATYTNHLLFPVTRERFLADLAQAAPALATGAVFLDAGDAINVKPESLLHEKGLSRYCKRLSDTHDWRLLEFRPFELGYEVREHRGEAFTQEECYGFISGLFEDSLRTHLVDQQARYEWHHRWEVVRQYEVVFHGGTRKSWTVDFRTRPATVSEGPSALATAHTVAPASLLVGLVAGTISWDYATMSSEIRIHDHTYKLSQTGLTRPNNVSLQDPLTSLLAGPEAEEHHLTLTIERLAQQNSNMTEETCEEITLDPRIDSESIMKDVLQRLSARGIALPLADGNSEEA